MRHRNPWWGTKIRKLRGLHLLKMFKLQHSTKSDQLILRKIIKTVATRCHILRLKCTKFERGWGSVPDPAGGAYSTPPDFLPGFE